MFAIIETGGRQYKVSPGSKIKVEKLGAADGANFSFDKVLLVAERPENRNRYTLRSRRQSERGKVLIAGPREKKSVFKYHAKNAFSKVSKRTNSRFTEVEVSSFRFSRTRRRSGPAAGARLHLGAKKFCSAKYQAFGSPIAS